MIFSRKDFLEAVRRKACATIRDPFTFVLYAVHQSARSEVATGVKAEMAPALLTRTSMRPKALRISPNAVLTEAVSVTSVDNVRIFVLGTAVWMVCAVSESFICLRPRIAISVDPAAAKA